MPDRLSLNLGLLPHEPVSLRLRTRQLRLDGCLRLTRLLQTALGLGQVGHLG